MTKELETGTLAELNVKPGDVVEHIRFAGGKSSPYKYHFFVDDQCNAHSKASEGWFRSSATSIFRIVSRASQSDTPKMLKEMTDAEIGALVRAQMSGKTLEWIDPCCPRGKWQKLALPLQEVPDFYACRIRPEPVRETVRGSYWHVDDCHCLSGAMVANATHRITFDLIDGKPNPASIRMEEL